MNKIKNSNINKEAFNKLLLSKLKELNAKYDLFVYALSQTVQLTDALNAKVELLNKKIGGKR